MGRCNGTELNSGYYFAALKLLEQLHLDGQLPAYIFRNILKDYTGTVDISKFIVLDEEEMEEKAA